MKAAVVTTFDTPPRYLDAPEPVARGDHEVVVDVLAAGLHPRVRSQADGSHYSSAGRLPLIPGVDAVVRDPEGRLRFAVLDSDTQGSMAERTVIELDRSVVLPDGVDPVLIAAVMNPAMSSWVALRQRVASHVNGSENENGSGTGRVLVLGATGNAGRIAIQVAKHLGAAHVIAAGRNEARLTGLPALGADETCTFDQLGECAGEVDVVLDYVWGEPTAKAMTAVLTSRADRARPLTWVEIGSVAGPTAPIPSAVLRQARLAIIGSGIGSVPGRDWVRELPELAAVAAEGAFDVGPRAVPLAEVEHVWGEAATAADRIVLVP